MAAEGRVPIRESIGAAVRMWREQAGFVLILAAVGALAQTALAMGAQALAANMGLGFLLQTALLLASAVLYAVLLGVFQSGQAGWAQRAGADGLRVFAAMAVVGFFLAIVFVVGGIPGFLILGMYLAPYMGDLEAAGQNETMQMEVMGRFVEENLGPVLAVTLVYALIWLALTSRLYLAAPATAAEKRVLTFETWAWTKNNMLRIAAARIALLFPAMILAGGLQVLFAAAIGVNVNDIFSVAALAQSNPALFALYSLIGQFLSLALLISLEAALSVYLYRGLKPAEAPPAG